jgi:activator of HSP90 ATPase
LATFYYKYERATLTIKEVKELKGESSVSIRKQKKIVTYDYNIKLLWKVDMGDETNSKVIGSIEGEYELPEVSNDVADGGDEWEINCRITAGDESLRTTLFQVVKKFAPDELRKYIQKNFVEELKKK